MLGSRVCFVGSEVFAFMVPHEDTRRCGEEGVGKQSRHVSGVSSELGGLCVMETSRCTERITMDL